MGERNASRQGVQVEVRRARMGDDLHTRQLKFRVQIASTTLADSQATCTPYRLRVEGELEEDGEK